jgi:NAD(P)-dependent dehydrogenase (short-subunit alcohol dehydrogenase family)
MATNTMDRRAILSGRVALVTGAGRGIGQAIALALADRGATLVVVDLAMDSLTETVALVRQQGSQVLAFAGDVANWRSVQAFVAEAHGEFGAIHVLVNNAGIQGPIGVLAENDVDAWRRTVEINLVGMFHCCKAVLPHMIKQGYGRIINSSGGGATAPRPNFSAYAVSKAAVVRLTETLAEEVRPYGIRVNAIAPGAVNTRMLDEVLAAGEAAGDELAAAQKRQAQGGTPAELAAGLVAFLASDASGDLTGKLISAPYDDWRTWDAQRIAELDHSPWYTLRRMDPHTLRPLMEQAK